ncbi:MAG: hypothetical protein ACU84H_17345 [Gammaproteobacteria bacterium]
MNNRYLHSKLPVLGLAIITVSTLHSAMAKPPARIFKWSTVVNNGDETPCAYPDPTCRKFNSYNQPSVNADGLVVFRARSKGGMSGEPEHGVYTRDMSSKGSAIVKQFDRNSFVPQPNNLDTLFVEPPSFPRIDIWSNTVTSRGNHQPVWEYTLPDNSDTRVGTNGIYTNPFGSLVTGAAKLGLVPDFAFLEVPEAPGTPFDAFPGAPAVTDTSTIVFKGNYTVAGVGKTGVYYRDLFNAPIPSSEGSLAQADGIHPVVLIANNTSTLIPGTQTVFGSTAPPSAANRTAVFAGFDYEEAPTKGGIFLAPLDGPEPALTTLVGIGSPVPGEGADATFNMLGEGVSFDGRFVAFWGAWGTETKSLTLQCPAEGNAERIAFCNEQYPDGFETQVPPHQGIFVHDIRSHATVPVAKAPTDFDDFVYWNFSGRVPGTGEGDDEDGEPARWRSSAFAAVSGLVYDGLNDSTFHIAFKARTGAIVEGSYVDPVDGIYLRGGPGVSPIQTLVSTGMDGNLIDPEAVFDDDENSETPPVSLPVTEMGIERDGFRGNRLAVNVSMGTEEIGWAGIYLTRIR